MAQILNVDQCDWSQSCYFQLEPSVKSSLLNLQQIINCDSVLRQYPSFSYWNAIQHNLVVTWPGPPSLSSAPSSSLITILLYFDSVWWQSPLLSLRNPVKLCLPTFCKSCTLAVLSKSISQNNVKRLGFIFLTYFLKALNAPRRRGQRVTSHHWKTRFSTNFWGQ